MEITLESMRGAFERIYLIVGVPSLKRSAAMKLFADSIGALCCEENIEGDILGFAFDSEILPEEAIRASAATKLLTLVRLADGGSPIVASTAVPTSVLTVFADARRIVRIGDISDLGCDDFFSETDLGHTLARRLRHTERDTPENRVRVYECAGRLLNCGDAEIPYIDTEAYASPDELSSAIQKAFGLSEHTDGR